MENTNIQGPIVEVLENNYRIARFGEWTYDRGQFILIRVCEELVEGRWEPFLSYR